METQPASKSIAYLKQQMMDVQKKDGVSLL
jgi:hypothetical protein